MRRRHAIVGLCAGAAHARFGWADEAPFVVDPGASHVGIRVGKAGVFGFLGHEHEIVGAPSGGSVQVDWARLDRAAVHVTFAARELRVTGRGEPPEDVPKVQAKMLGPECLDVARYPTIEFTSTAVAAVVASPEPGTHDVRLAGRLSLHGIVRDVALPVRVVSSPTVLRASGQTTLRQTAFGINPISVGGVVKAADQFTVEFVIAARRGLALR